MIFKGIGRASYMVGRACISAECASVERLLYGSLKNRKAELSERSGDDLF